MVPRGSPIPVEQMKILQAWGGSIRQEAEQLHKPDLLSRTHSQTKTKNNYGINHFQN